MLALFTVALLYYLWEGRFGFHHFPALLAVEAVCLGLVIASHLTFKADLKSLGLSFSTFGRATRYYGGLTILGCLMIAALGWNNSDLNYRVWDEAPGYLVWAGIQQYVLQNFFLRLSLIIFAPGRSDAASLPGSRTGLRPRLLASLLSAAVFSLFHFPSPAFVAVTFAAAFAWCFIYTSSPSFYWSWISHFLLGICLSFFLKSSLMGQLQVGQGGFRFEAYGDGLSVAAGYSGDGEPFIAAVKGPDKGNSSLIKVFTPHGKALASWVAFPEFDFSAVISAGDAGFGPGDEIIAAAGPGPGNPPVVRIFSRQGELLGEIEISDPDFPRSHGAWAQVSRGLIYISPGPAPRSPQLVAEYSTEGKQLRKWSLDDSELAADISFHNGVRGIVVAHGDPMLLRWGSGISVNPSSVVVSETSGENLEVLETFPTTFGLNLTPVTLGNGDWGIAVGPGPLKGYPPWIKVFSATEDWKKIIDVVPWDDDGSCGVNLASVDVDGDGVDELVAGEGWGEGRPFLVRIVNLKGEVIFEWAAF